MAELRICRPFALTVCLLLAAGAASAGGSFSTLPAGSVRLITPAPGTVLRGGSTTELSWELSAEAIPGASEWEVFLSVDGGRRYPYRLTPHLNLTLSRFRVELPDVPTSSARFLLRFGDEQSEHEIEIPETFEIRSGLTPSASRIELRAHHGEAARPGLPGVVRWVDGTRDGKSLRVRATWTAGELRPAFQTDLEARPVAVFRFGPPQLLPPAPDSSTPRASTPELPAVPTPRLTSGSDLRLLICRANE